MNRITINISAIKIHIYINTFTHENQGNEFLINECNKPIGDGTTMFHPTIEWLSQISPQSFTNVRLKPKEPTRAYRGYTTSPTSTETGLYRNPSWITRPTQ